MEEPIFITSDPEDTIKRPTARKNRTLSMPESTILLDRVAVSGQPEEERPAKRERERTQQTQSHTGRQQDWGDEDVRQLEKLLKETTEIVNKVRGISEKLNDLVAKNTNTKVEIKRDVEELDWASKRLETRGNKMIEPMKELCGRVTKTRVETATQTEERGDSEKREQENNEVIRIQEAFRKRGGMQEFLEVSQNNWPQRCFTRVRTESKDIFELSRDWDLATLVPENFDMEKGDNKNLRDHFQGIEDLRNQEVEMGGVTHLVEQVGIPGKEGEIRNKSRYVYYGVTTEVGMDILNVREVLACLSKMRNLMKNQKREKLAIVAIGKINLGYLKKAAEFVFVNDDIEVILLKDRRVVSGEGQRKKPQMSNTQKTGKGRREETLIIKVTDRKPYAELLQEVRKEVDLDSTGVKVTNIRKTRSGDISLSIKTKEGESQAAVLEREINKKLAGTQTKVIQERGVTLQVNGMDAATSSEELSEALREALGNPSVNIKVNALWPAFGTTQNAMVTTNKADADTLLDRAKVKVGWVNCKI